MELSDTTVLLTGATGGIGQAIARDLAGRGAKLTLTGRQGDVLDALASELDARALVVDLSNAAEVDRLLAEAGDVDILVANAALPGSARLDSYSVEQIDRVLDVNLRAPIVLAHGLLPRMLERGKGHLVFISSLSGKAATAKSSLYNATKFGLRGFSHAMRAELRNDGVGVSVICPGFIRDAGMFANSGVKLPPGIGTRTPEDVAHAVRVAIERNRGEVDVAPVLMRGASTFAGLAPDLAAGFTRVTGANKITDEMAEGQRTVR